MARLHLATHAATTGMGRGSGWAHFALCSKAVHARRRDAASWHARLRSASETVTGRGQVQLKIKIRLSTQQELLWSGPPETSVAVLKKFVEEQESIAPGRQRFLFGGQLLQDSKTLAAAKVPSNCVVQVMVNPATQD